MKRVDVSGWNRKTTYEWFSSFPDPTVGLTVRMDVTQPLRVSRESGTSSFLNLTYLIAWALNRSDGFLYRETEEGVFLSKPASPCVTVLRPDGSFGSCRLDWSERYEEFYREAERKVAEVKAGGKGKPFEDGSRDVFYFSCLPWTDFLDVRQPVPPDLFSRSVPRVAWGKYRTVGTQSTVAMQILANHALLDGRELSEGFREIGEAFERAETLLKREIER